MDAAEGGGGKDGKSKSGSDGGTRDVGSGSESAAEDQPTNERTADLCRDTKAPTDKNEIANARVASSRKSTLLLLSCC